MEADAPLAVTGFDHLAVANVERTCDFYRRVLGMRPIEHQPGKWALEFGMSKISLQLAGAMPEIATNTTAGSANFCVLTEHPIEHVADHLAACGVEVVAGPIGKIGAVGPMMSVYFHDPDGNLVEVAQPQP